MCQLGTLQLGTLLLGILLLGILLLGIAAEPSRAQTCTPDAQTLCLQAQRFAVSVTWTDFSDRSGVGTGVSLTEDAGYFWFFRPGNVELVVKVLDGRGANGHFWFFFGGLSTVGYELEVTDTATGEQRIYRNRPGELRSLADVRAFPLGSPLSAGDLGEVPAEYLGSPPRPVVDKVSSECSPSDTRLCLQGGRFQVEVDWVNPLAGDVEGPAQAVDLTPDAGYFWFARPGNVEIVVKVLDGRLVNGDFWVFWGALSNLDYEIRVTDTRSGQVRQYRNPRGRLASGADNHAFVPSANPPLAAHINEPAVDDQEISAFDVHIETDPFADPDPGDTHYCSDFEILHLDADTLQPLERAWVAPCVIGAERVHIHLGDGRFEGSFALRQSLLPEAVYLLRLRHVDSTGLAGPWAERRFRTQPQTGVRALEVADLVVNDALSWRSLDGEPVVLPGSEAAEVVLEGPPPVRFLTLRGLDGSSNQVDDAPPLARHEPLRVRLAAGSAALQLPATDLTVTDSGGETHTIFLPAVDLPAGQSQVFWVSSNGSTYHGQAPQRIPRFTELARSSPVPWQVMQPGYQVEIVSEGFQLPVNLAFLPPAELAEQDAAGVEPSDPWFYVTELYGNVKLVRRDGSVEDFATDLLNFNPTGNFPGSGEMGVSGLAVHPETGDVYVALVYAQDPTSPNPIFRPRVVRFEGVHHARHDAEPVTVLDLATTAQSPSHQISNLSFGPDGKLYVHLGDAARPFDSQNLERFTGKILRLEPDGTAAVDNPFYDESDGLTATDYLYAYGFRNPFGGAWRAADGVHYQVENGPSVDRFARVDAGQNYGWGTPGIPGNELMEIGAIYNWPIAHAPVNLAFVQAETFEGSGFPAAKQDHAFVTESGPTWAPGPMIRGKRIVEFVLDANGGLVAGPLPLIEYNGSGRSTAVGLAAGPDGLYFSDFYRDVPSVSGPAGAIERGSRILRVRYIQD